MIVSELLEVAAIDIEILELHERLSSLYDERAAICAQSGKIKTILSATNAYATSSAFDDTINLDGISLALND